jgi:hypothetical protein
MNIQIAPAMQTKQTSARLRCAVAETSLGRLSRGDPDGPSNVERINTC